MICYEIVLIKPSKDVSRKSKAEKNGQKENEMPKVCAAK